MASVTLSTLETSYDRLIKTGSAAFRRWIVVEGPVKKEYIFAQCATGDAFTNDDTTTSRMAHPIAASVASVNNDLGGTAFAGSVSLDNDESSATFKTITLRDITTATDGILITVLGY